MQKVLTLKNGIQVLENIGSGIGNYFTKSNRFYSSPANSTALGTATLVANTIYAMPFIAEKDIEIDAVRIVVTTVGVGSQVKAGIYKDLDSYPEAILANFGSLPGTAVGNLNYTNSLPLKIEKGLYWLVVLSTVNLTIRGFAAAGLNPVLGYDTNLNTIPGLGYSILQPSGLLPNNFPLLAAIRTTIPLPTIAVRPK
jgi:hypothetical protein